MSARRLLMALSTLYSWRRMSASTSSMTGGGRGTRSTSARDDGGVPDSRAAQISTTARLMGKLLRLVPMSW